MASSMDPPIPLKNKLSHVKDLLEDANERLQEEASKCQIYTIESNASTASGSNTHHQKQAFGNQYVPQDLIRTISDIDTLKTVLSCPIFNRIVNVTDSLDKLSYHLNLHPSIGPSDINIDADGELILAPPFEPSSLNNLINSRLDEFSDHSNSSPRILSPNIVHNNNQTIINNHNVQHQAQHINLNGSTELNNCNGGFAPYQQQQQLPQQSFLENSTAHVNQHHYDGHAQSAQNFSMSPSILSSLNSYDTEKLVSNGACKTYLVCNKPKPDATRMDLACNDQRGFQRLYKSNGDFTLDQIAPDSMDAVSGFHTSPTQICDFNDNSQGNGFSNEMYKTTYELSQQEIKRTAHQKIQSHNAQNNGEACLKNIQSHISPTNGRIQSLQGSAIQHGRGSCSPSTSAGSTVRLADDCDSGASSYQSQNVKVVTPFSYQKSAEHIENSRVQNNNEETVETMERELSKNPSPEMERITVTLEKDDKGLGITIAGYTHEAEEISGIFIKSITPESPAGRSGKIRTFDQIFSVNGRELLDYSNHEAVHVLKHTGKVVTLELIRAPEAKYRKIESALSHAVPTLNTSTLKLSNQENAQTPSNGAQSSKSLIMSPTKSSIPVFKTRENLNLSPTKSKSPMTNKPTFVQVSNGQQQASSEVRSIESIYKNDIVDDNKPGYGGVSLYSNQTSSSSPDSQGHIPVAAQRSGSNKVIETLQGARNTIDIKSPACQATYVNKAVEMEHYNSKKSVTSRSQSEIIDEFGQIINRGWEKDAQIIELHKDASQGLGFTVKEYTNPKEQKQSIIMIYSITPGGIAEKDGRLTKGDLLIFVDDTNLEGASLQETVRALRKTNGQVRLGVLKLKQKEFDAQE